MKIRHKERRLELSNRPSADILVNNKARQAIILVILTIILTSICRTQAQDSSTDLPSAGSSITEPTTSRDLQAISELLSSWAISLGREIHFGTQQSTCHESIRNQYDPSRSDTSQLPRATIESTEWIGTHADIVRTISTHMGWHKKAVEAIARASEDLAGNHTFQKKLLYNYTDVHRLYNSDAAPHEEDADYTEDPNATGANNEVSQPEESADNQEMGHIDDNGSLVTPETQSDPPLEPLPTPARLESDIDPTSSEAYLNMTPAERNEWKTPIRYLKLSKHRNFDDVLINTEESAVHIPVHIFPGDDHVMNGIQWSDGLTKVFRDNFVRNPRLTNQYFASQLGFMRLFPAQIWQIARTDPDLYDARMRPWYVAGASSRKDVIILVDSSGSMTGSRRDVAKGVVFEILDTLTDNDHFIVLKFSDTVQQVGVPGCSSMRVEKTRPSIPPKNTVHLPGSYDSRNRLDNETDINSLYFLPATGRNVRHVKSNFTIPTAGIANFSRALITAFEVLRNYQDSESLGSQCNQAIMLITDGSPSDFEDIFNQYNYPNAPVRVFTYLIGREAGDITHTKMMACHNRGFYTHVINLAEVRETVQQYIPVMARPLVLNGTHPITWTSAYGELTYQILTDWIWESKRRDKAREMLANSRKSVTVLRRNEDVYPSESDLDDPQDPESEPLDLFGYESPECFWETRRNDLLTTVVQPVYDRNNESYVTEKFLVKNTWKIEETKMRTAQILGVAAADMQINNIIALAPSHKLGPNGYAIMLTNNGHAMHHPDLRSILEPFTSDPSEKNMRILKPFFSSLDLTQLEHVTYPTTDSNLIQLREKAVKGLPGLGTMMTKRTVDCQKRVQTRSQTFYFKPIDQFPFSFMIAIPESYGLHRIEAKIELKSAMLREKLTNYFTTSDHDFWTAHPEYQYCDGPSNNTITTLLDLFQRIEQRRYDDIQWRPTESTNPPLPMADKLVCDRDLVQSFAYDAIATYNFSMSCSMPSPNAESNLLKMTGARFAFVATRSGFTRVRHFESDSSTVKREALAFAANHGRAIDETYFSRTVDYNMLVNETATLLQVPFNTYKKIDARLNDYLNSRPEETIDLTSMSLTDKLNVLANSSLHVIATQSLIVKEGSQRAVAGVTGVFYDYVTFVSRFLNSTSNRFQDGSPITKPAACYNDNPNDESCNRIQTIKCGLPDDSLDCLLIDNNGYIIFSENLAYIGRHLKAYDEAMLYQMVKFNVFHEVTITDYQSICMRKEEKKPTTSGMASRIFRRPSGQSSSTLSSVVNNLITAMSYSWTILATTSNLFGQYAMGIQPTLIAKPQYDKPALLPAKTYLRPCEKNITLYETRAGKHSSESPEQYSSSHGCKSWFIYEQIPYTNLILLVVDSACGERGRQSQFSDLEFDTVQEDVVQTAEGVCTMVERESQLYRQKLNVCISHHPDEESIKLCGGAGKTIPTSLWLLFLATMISATFSLIHIRT